MKRWLAWLWVAFLVSIPWWLADQYFLHTLINTGIFAIAAMSLNLLLGYTGQLSLGHVAFFGIGAYTSALIALGFFGRVKHLVGCFEPKLMCVKHQ